MSLKLEDVKGLGKKVDTLKEAGIDSVEKLANSKIKDLIDLKGIGKATAEKIVENAKELLESPKDESEEVTDEKKIEEEIKKLEERKLKLQGKKVEDGDFILVKLTARTQKGTIFRVSSEEDAKKAGIFDEQKAKQGYYTPLEIFLEISYEYILLLHLVLPVVLFQTFHHLCFQLLFDMRVSYVQRRLSFLILYL